MSANFEHNSIIAVLCPLFGVTKMGNDDAAIQAIALIADIVFDCLVIPVVIRFMLNSVYLITSDLGSESRFGPLVSIDPDKVLTDVDEEVLTDVNEVLTDVDEEVLTDVNEVLTDVDEEVLTDVDEEIF